MRVGQAGAFMLATENVLHCNRDSIKKKKKVLHIFLEAALGVEQVGAFEASELCSIEFSNHESCAFFVT